MAEPEAAAQPKRRARRTREEMAAVKAQGVISVSIDSTAYEGSAADVALLRRFAASLDRVRPSFAPTCSVGPIFF